MKRLPDADKFRRRGWHPRRGSWLGQMVVTMTVMSALLTIVSTALFRMYRQEATMVEQAWQSSVWQKLNRDFRQDLHQASAATLSEDNDEIRIQLADTPIVWKVDGDAIRRVNQAGDETADPLTQPGDRYRFPDAIISLSLKTGEDSMAIASIEVDPASNPGGLKPPLSGVVATVGLDHRFVGEQTEGTP